MESKIPLGPMSYPLAKSGFSFYTLFISTSSLSTTFPLAIFSNFHFEVIDISIQVGPVKNPFQSCHHLIWKIYFGCVGPAVVGNTLIQFSCHLPRKKITKNTYNASETSGCFTTFIGFPGRDHRQGAKTFFEKN